MAEITEREFRLFQRLVYDAAGIHLNDTKKLLVAARLGKRIRALRLACYQEYYDFLLHSAAGSEEFGRFINAITTNKTDFFREPHHLDYLKKTILPELVTRGDRNIRIWSAGCSTGQEPYSIAMVVRDVLGAAVGLDVKILATDLDTDVLTVAKRGVYDAEKAEQIPPPLRKRYVKIGEHGTEMSPNITSLITFRRLNLVQERFPFRFGFNVIFCRNVMIYFRPDDRPPLLERFRVALRPEGYLILGHSESLLSGAGGFSSVSSTVYRRT